MPLIIFNIDSQSHHDLLIVAIYTRFCMWQLTEIMIKHITKFGKIDENSMEKVASK